jgi:hypothetical protein
MDEFVSGEGQLTDTSPWAAEIQASIYRRMTGEERLRLAVDERDRT